MALRAFYHPILILARQTRHLSKVISKKEGESLIHLQTIMQFALSLNHEQALIISKL
jgi:hypothetical protein